MDFPTFNQQNYGEELGTGTGISIKDYGCALTCVAADCVHFGMATSPSQLNQDLINNSGYASNGQGDFDLIEWDALSKIYSDITLDFNNSYPLTPADMGLLDAQLAKNSPVIVGVSFTHNPKTTQATHYVIIHTKNSDGTYECMDPWIGENCSFDSNYAVNGMTASDAILQMVSYSGPQPVVTPSEPTNQYSEKQAIIDAYQALVGMYPSDDELSYKLEELSKGENMVDVFKEFKGDSRFHVLNCPTVPTVPTVIAQTSLPAELPQQVIIASKSKVNLFSRILNWFR